LRNQILEPFPSYCDRWSQQASSFPSIATKDLGKKTSAFVQATLVQNHPTTRNADPKNGPELVRLLRKQRTNSSNEQAAHRQQQ
jgi:hypothetical protein